MLREEIRDVVIEVVTTKGYIPGLGNDDPITYLQTETSTSRDKTKFRYQTSCPDDGCTVTIICECLHRLDVIRNS